jgi:hypothetical protein
MQVTRYIGLPLIWNAAIAYILLVALPIAFGAKRFGDSSFSA